MGPSEAEIASRITALNGEQFQRLAEVYARRTYQERFKELKPTGRNITGSTTKGLWDAVVTDPAGNVIDVVEATHTTAARSHRWQQHLEQKLAEAEKAGARGLKGFLYVAWYDEPRNETVELYRQRVADLGIRPDSIQLVFRSKLTYDLSRPLFADTWEDLLGLPSSCLPFELVSQLRARFGEPGKMAIFAPTKQEYIDGCVRCPSLADAVEARLGSEGWALVRGLGASGKTVLALQLALARLPSSGPAYYLDLESDADPARAAEVISTRADGGVLFVLDNVHLDEQGAGQIFDHWKEVARGSHLLMLGRITSLPPSSKGLARPLVDLEPGAMLLRVESEDLAGVFNRLGSRFLALQGVEKPSVPVPPPAVLNNWLDLFGGDLIAFSAAVVARIHSLLGSKWELKEEDAANYVREHYLAPLDESELKDLLVVSTLAALEVRTPRGALASGTLTASLRSGLIHHTVRGREKHESFHLVHPGMGNLLRKAASDPGNELDMFVGVAGRSPFVGMVLASRLEAQNRGQECTAVLRAATTSAGGLKAALLVPGLTYAQGNAKRLARSGVTAETHMDDELARCPSELVSAALNTPLHFLGAFLDYAEHKMPKVHGTLSAALAEPASLKELTQIAMRTAFADLTSFLEYAERRLPNVLPPIATALSDPANLNGLVQIATRTAPPALTFFLEYAERKLSKVHDALTAAFAEAASTNELAQTALRTSLGGLGSLLEYAERKLPKVRTAIAGTLADPGNREKLTQTALRTPLGQLASFLDYAEHKLPKVYIALATTLAEPRNAKALAQRALGTPPGDLALFLKRTEDKLPEAHAAVATGLADPANLRELTRSWLRAPLDPLACFLKYVEDKLPELYTAIATALGDPANLKELTETALHTSLEQLTFFLKYADDKLPELHMAIATALGEPANLKQLTETALRTSLEHLTFFLKYADDNLPKVYAGITAALIDPNNTEELTETAVRSSLGHLASFFEYAGPKLPRVSSALRDELRRPQNVQKVADEAARTPLGSLLAFLRSECLKEAVQTVVASIDQGRWDESRLGMGSEQPSFFPDLCAELRRLGRPELGQAPARALIRAAEADHWHTPVIGLHHLSHALREGRGAGEALVDRFLDRVVTEPWLVEQYGSASAGTIAATLFTLWGYCEESVWKRFRTNALRGRVVGEIRCLGYALPEDISGVLQLLGCSALVGVETRGTHVSWPDESQLANILESNPPSSDLESITQIQAQLWLGLREMARLRSDSVRAPAEKGKQILELWRRAEPLTERLGRLNAWMIEWLERCREGGWILLRDNSRPP